MAERGTVVPQVTGSNPVAENINNLFIFWFCGEIGYH